MSVELAQCVDRRADLDPVFRRMLNTLAEDALCFRGYDLAPVARRRICINTVLKSVVQCFRDSVPHVVIELEHDLDGSLGFGTVDYFLRFGEGDDCRCAALVEATLFGHEHEDDICDGVGQLAMQLITVLEVLCCCVSYI